MYHPFAIIFLVFLVDGLRAQLVSPCPRLFTYEPQKETDRWYGIVTLLSESDLSGTWLRLIFDKPSLQLGNWFGEVTTTDNKEYLIKNRGNTIKANTPQTIRFFVKYDPNQPAPQLISFRLNAKTVCPEQASSPTTPATSGELMTSNPVGGPQLPAAVTGGNNLGAVVQRPNLPPAQPAAPPGGGSGGDDDVFQGDFFNFFNKPQSGVPSIQDLQDAQAICGTIATSHKRPKRQNYEVYRVDLDRGWHYPLQGWGRAVKHLRPQTKGQDDIAPLQAQPRPLITYGQATHEGQFPWHAALYHAKGIDLAYICGASLISKWHVITVAHCVTKRRTQLPLSTDSLVVYLGKYYLKRWSNPGIQDKQVASIIPHPKYDPQTYKNDISLIKLSSNVEFTDYVRPICIWEGQTQLNNIINHEGTVVGWGFDETGKVTEQLMQAQMPVVSQETCIFSFPEFFSRFTSSNTFCAGFRNGTSVCNGDSGGGMVFPKPTSNRNRPVYQLRGLVSISVALQNQFKCDATHYVVFTDVAQYVDWIKQSQMV